MTIGVPYGSVARRCTFLLLVVTEVRATLCSEPGCDRVENDFLHTTRADDCRDCKNPYDHHEFRPDPTSRHLEAEYVSADFPEGALDEVFEALDTPNVEAIHIIETVSEGDR